MQFSLFETPENNSSSHKLPLSEGDVTYFPHALSKNDADTFFEKIDPLVWELTEKTDIPHDEQCGLSYTYEIWKRRKTPQA